LHFFGRLHADTAPGRHPVKKPTSPPEADGRRFHISVYPPQVTGRQNPYFDQYHAALARRGISTSDDLVVDLEWLEARARDVDALHFHWPEDIWRQGFGRAGGRLGRAVRAAAKLMHLRRFLGRARRLGMKRLWTVHNLEPHEGAYRWDRYGYRLLARECDVVVCHSRSAAAAVNRLFAPRANVIVMPHGQLGSAYPPARPRSLVLNELALDQRLPVVCALGRLRTYKGLDLVCDIAAHLAGRVQILVGGERNAGFDSTPLVHAAERVPGFVLIQRALTSQEFVDFVAASDAMLLPYSKVTSSGVLLAALGLDRGVVASDLTYFREILEDEPDAGMMVASRDPGVWAESILAYLARPEESRREAAHRLADKYSWDHCVEPMVSALLSKPH
jgi:glycosyltransferase involved in cell wall biosynthesis